ncbi:MAG TPA: zinc ribbon domain-containing protein [Candidatus Dormibacteraeota bacterium]
MRGVLGDTVSLLVVGVVALLGYMAVLWVATAFFVWRDARRRSSSPPFQLFALLLGFVPPFLGALVYLVIRPPRTLDEERAFALEEQTMLDIDNDTVALRPCPSCGREIEPEFIVCPHCRTQFARRCHGCDRVLRLGWAVCPYCAEEVGHTPLGRATRTG